MTGIREAVDDIAAEITPASPPVELTMRRGRRMRNGRLAAIIGGTAGTVIIGTGMTLSIPGLVHQHGSPADGTVASQAVAPAVRGPLVRPVLLFAPAGGPAGRSSGDVRMVDAGTLQLFRQFTCQQGAAALAADQRLEAALGYTAAQWNAPEREIVACDAEGNEYALGQAVVLGTQVTSATTAQLGRPWVVNLTLDAAAAKALGTLTTVQYDHYYPGAATNPDDAALDENAIMLNGSVLEAPLTAGPLTHGELTLQGQQPQGFTQAKAQQLAAMF